MSSETMLRVAEECTSVKLLLVDNIGMVADESVPFGQMVAA